MLKNWNALYQLEFLHDGETSDCVVNLLSKSKGLVLFDIHSFVFGSSPSRFIFGSCKNHHWLINVDDESVVFINTPSCLSSTAEDLQELDLDEDQADELASFIQMIQSSLI